MVAFSGEKRAMWKVHATVLSIATVVLALALWGSQLMPGSVIDRALGSLDIWLQGALAYPTLGAAALGVIFAYVAFGLLVTGRQYRLLQWMVRLADLWSEGVAIRNDGLELATDSQVTAWVDRRYGGWHNRVAAALELQDPVDVRFFATLRENDPIPAPSPPPSTPPVRYLSVFHRDHLLTLAQELDNLRAIIVRHHERLSDPAAALLTWLNQKQGASFGKVLQVREVK
jgi:hypothetical protein